MKDIYIQQIHKGETQRNPINRRMYNKSLLQRVVQTKIIAFTAPNWNGILPVLSHYHHSRYRTFTAHIHASSGIETRDPCVRAMKGRTCLRPRGHWDRPVHSPPEKLF